MDGRTAPVIWNSLTVGASAPAARPGNRPAAKPGREWYRIENQTDADTAEVWIYDEIGYWGVTAGAFVDELKAITAPRIVLHLNSPGGDVFDGIAIYNALLTHQATVEVSIEALAASAASFIAMAGDSITIARNARMMIHDANGLCYGNADDMQAMADLLASLSDNIASIYNDRANGGVKSWRAAMREETWYSADEAVEAGLADKVAALPKREENRAHAAVAQWDLSVFRNAEATTGTPAAPVIATRPTAADPPADPPPAPDPDPDPPAAGHPPPPPEEPPPAAGLDPSIFDDIDLDLTALKVGLLDAAEDTFEVDTEPIRAAMDEPFEFDPDVFRSAALDATRDAPAPPPVPDQPLRAARHIGIDEFANSLRDALLFPEISDQPTEAVR